MIERDRFISDWFKSFGGLAFGVVNYPVDDWPNVMTFGCEAAGILRLMNLIVFYFYD